MVMRVNHPRFAREKVDVLICEHMVYVRHMPSHYCVP